MTTAESFDRGILTILFHTDDKSQMFLSSVTDQFQPAFIRLKTAHHHASNPSKQAWELWTHHRFTCRGSRLLRFPAIRLQRELTRKLQIATYLYRYEWEYSDVARVDQGEVTVMGSARQPAWIESGLRKVTTLVQDREIICLRMHRFSTAKTSCWQCSWGLVLPLQTNTDPKSECKCSLLVHSSGRFIDRTTWCTWWKPPPYPYPETL